eukprot:gene11631-24356_t
MAQLTRMYGHNYIDIAKEVKMTKHHRHEKNELSSELKLFIAVTGIYSCYIAYGIYQEALYHYKSAEGMKFTATFFFLLVQCLTNVVLAGIFMLYFGGSKKKPPTINFVVVGFSYIGAMLFSNEALKYVSYPTQALGKSCKMIPVMLFGFLIRGKKYSLMETFAVLLITAGINVFQQGKSGGNNSVYGLVLLFLSLVLDGVTGASQDKLQETYTLTTHELMFYLNFWAVVLLLVLSAATGQIYDGVIYCLHNPEVVKYLIIASITSALGQNFIFYTISNFNSLVLATVTTTRKFFTILVSVFFFGHELKQHQWVAVGMVFAGLSLELVEKYRSKGKKHKHGHHSKGDHKDKGVEVQGEVEVQASNEHKKD